VRRQGGRALLAALAASLTVAVAPGSAQTTPDVPWPSLLPAGPAPVEVQPGPVARCRRPTLRCVDGTLRIMRRLRTQLGCDHRAVFATTYTLLTEEIRRTLVRQPRFFDDRRYLIWEITEFANFYFRTLADNQAGRPVPEAWGISVDAARTDGANGGQDMLLGINAHVQRDMPYVVAALGLRTPSGASRKPDHDRVNQILNRAYERIVRTIGERYDPLLFTTNASWNPVDNIGGLELVKGWREGVWRNAERLLAASSPEERKRVADSIELNAAMWARGMAAPQVPGYRAQRDAYCAAQR
jgi:Family of unknown function (DUF5995)